MFHALYKTPVVNTRIFMAYGPRPRPDICFAPYVINSLLSGEAPKLTSGGRKVDWIYIEDVVDGLLACARSQSQDLLGQTVDLGSGCLTESRAVSFLIAKLVGTEVRPEFGALADRPTEQVRVAEVQRAFEQLGWRPKTSLGRECKLLSTGSAQ